MSPCLPRPPTFLSQWIRAIRLIRGLQGLVAVQLLWDIRDSKIFRFGDDYFSTLDLSDGLTV